ncbi:HoxN/HupN/NixA family nickel/cobalt transporter [Pediococcus claussenii]|uniref:Nickel/cobalt efflux system n=1 Tax=Pediococcus claussenii (strain ATCC BAA-344 / DSM 14800 / JCM 18046 / KCTC 3811 / LMG 21948 / P06) TaxID=701521 RepID=G8PEW9_PEDCP|nr:nickel permease [Pediococcus claussenii]AEV95648.1 high-affinity nickel-transport protein nixA [Pediococcus claussenii ATCC BAA-344]ANZ69167.1 nickel permease [Pediococcus claussenii]ANZ70984.1 nickel permease [Pediococcus claussenii]KRN20119.1 nixA protein [Pediococcus claussenii]
MEQQIKHYPLAPDIGKFGGYVLLLFVVGWGLVFTYLNHYPALLGMAFLSFAFGLQHAFDVDHISAIDNMTRKLVNDNKNTHGVGFYFSFGHSLVVIIMALITIFFVEWSKTKLPQLQDIGGVFGTLFAGFMLLLLGLINLTILVGIWRSFKAINRGQSEEAEQATDTKVFRFFKRSLNLIKHNWQVICVGFLFGLGFDTATQIAVLATSAVATSKGIPWYAVFSFPLLFTSGMCFMDSCDGLFMSTAYSWVFSSPYRKVYYNLALTGLSVSAAFFVGIIDVLQALGTELHSNFFLIQWAQALNFNMLGIILVCLFILTWAIALLCWRIFDLNQKDEELKEKDQELQKRSEIF